MASFVCGSPYSTPVIRISTCSSIVGIRLFSCGLDDWERIAEKRLAFSGQLSGKDLKHLSETVDTERYKGTKRGVSPGRREKWGDDQGKSQARAASRMFFRFCNPCCKSRSFFCSIASRLRSCPSTEPGSV